MWGAIEKKYGSNEFTPAGFGISQATSPSPAKATASPPPAGSGLFGGPAATSPPAAAGSGLFGGPAATSPPPAAAGSDLFGGPAAISPPPAAAGSGLFGPPAAAGSGLFGGLGIAFSAAAGILPPPQEACACVIHPRSPLYAHAPLFTCTPALPSPSPLNPQTRTAAPHLPPYSSLRCPCSRSTALYQSPHDALHRSSTPLAPQHCKYPSPWSPGIPLLCLRESPPVCGAPPLCYVVWVMLPFDSALLYTMQAMEETNSWCRCCWMRMRKWTLKMRYPCIAVLCACTFARIPPNGSQYRSRS